MKKRSLLVSLVFSCFVVTANSFVVAQTNPARKTLGGLKEVHVLIEEIQPEFEQDGLSDKQLKTDVELRLRKAGIRVTDSAIAPDVYVNVNIVRLDSPCPLAFAFSINIEFNQLVILERNKTIYTTAPTWAKSAVGALRSGRLFIIRERVGEILDEFINDFLAENPK